MRRLYLRFYVAVLASLAVFAIIAGVAWRLGAEAYGPRQAASASLAGELVAELLPEGQVDAHELHERLERWNRRTGFDIALFASDGTPLAASGHPLPAPAPGDSGWLAPRDGPPAFAAPLPDGRTLVLRRPPRGDRRWPRGAWPGFFVTLAVLAVAVGVGAYPVVRRLTRRLERLQRSVDALGAGNLETRVPVEGRDEIAALAASFNRSAARIEALVGAHKRLLAHASHELRSPLARIRMAVELLSKDAPAGLRDELARDVAELDALIDEILLASRLDAGTADAAPKFGPVDLVALVAEEAARQGVGFTAVGPGGNAPAGVAATIEGDERLLRRAVRNLIENARRHGAPPVDVEVEDGPQVMTVAVMDRGPGVPADERERIFEPFHRVRGASESQGGVGLGLALVRRIALLHAGEVRCVGRDGGGSRFVLRIARHPEPRPSPPAA